MRLNHDNSLNIAMLDSSLYSYGEHKIRVTRFPQLSFGHICLDWHMTLQLALREGSHIFFVPPEKRIHTGVFELTCDTTHVLGANDMPPLEHCSVIYTGEPTFPYYRRRLISPGLSLTISDNKLEELYSLLHKINLDLNSKIVCLHVREFGWYGRIGHESANLDTASYPTNATFSSYRPTIDYLLSKGYTVVRVGAPSQTRITGNGIIDLANSPHRTDLLELFCLMKSRFLLASESGIRQAAELFRLPTLTVNAVDALAVYPLGSKDLYILKHVVDKQSGRRLSLPDMLSHDYNFAYRDTERWHYLENSEDEILQAVIEMEQLVDGTYRESELQREFKNAVSASQETLWDSCFYVKKWGIDDGFIGDGLMAHFFLSKEWESTGQSRLCATVQNSSAQKSQKYTPATAYWKQRNLLANQLELYTFINTIVGHQANLSSFSLSQLSAMALEFKPDLIVELGRRKGGSTCLFTDVANRLGGRSVCQVSSLCSTRDFVSETIPALIDKKLIDQTWVEPLDCWYTDILAFDFEKLFRDKNRILLFWDVQGYDVASCVLGVMLPLLEDKQHVVIINNLYDQRYCSDETLLYNDQPLWRMDKGQGRRIVIENINFTDEHVIPVIDFSSRNSIELLSAAHSNHTELAPYPERLDEMHRLLGDHFFSLQGHWICFSLNDYPGPFTYPRFVAPEKSRVPGSVDLMNRYKA